MLSDPIADMLTRVRNALMAGKKETEMPYSRIKETIAKILVKEGYLTGMSCRRKKFKSKTMKTIICGLKYKNKSAAIAKIKRLSKPGVRLYCPVKKLPRRRGIIIVSTSKGLMTAFEARKKNLGGELICQVW